MNGNLKIVDDPTYTLTLTFNKDEIKRFQKIICNIGGSGPSRKIVDALHALIPDIDGVPSYERDKNQIIQEMVLSGK